MSKHSLKKGDPIPDDEYVVRYCQEGTWTIEREIGYVFFQEAFESERFPDEGVSVNWFGYWRGGDEHALRRILETTGHKGMRQEGRFLRLKSDDIRKLGLESSNNHLNVYYHPRGENKSHSEILPPGDEARIALRVHVEQAPCVMEFPSKL